MTTNKLLAKSIKGDIKAFHKLFNPFKEELKSFLYRLTTDRYLIEDLYHDTFIRSFDKIQTFKGDSSLKTWIFKISYNLTIDYLRKQNRWAIDHADKSRSFAYSIPGMPAIFEKMNKEAKLGAFEIREHIDFCFTCMGRVLEIEKQVTLILKDIYHFTIKEIAVILDFSPHNIKRLLAAARKTLNEIFEQRCALINKNGVCHQCSELSNWFNGAQKTKEAIVQLNLEKEKHSKKHLFKLRTVLIENINPLNSSGTDLHHLFMDITRVVEGEIKTSEFFKFKERDL